MKKGDERRDERSEERMSMNEVKEGRKTGVYRRTNWTKWRAKIIVYTDEYNNCSCEERKEVSSVYIID